jgi:hypothetical protein
MINFYDDAFPVLDAMSRFEPADRYDTFNLIGFLQDDGKAPHEIQDLAKLLLADGFITAVTGKADGMGNIMVHDPKLTPKALKLLGLWPSEDAEMTYLLQRVADALEEQAATDSDHGEKGRLATAASVLRDFAVSGTASVASGGLLS